ncbi:Eco57I restriction-modification methylase domain-containing protein [Leifsonia aquatica]|uniref:Eco57I restriction-modification methylase domain-containing protein n=1 Tax=Leifsonia aquatica TaxID=144185 RepID=UPI00384BB45E
MSAVERTPVGVGEGGLPEPAEIIEQSLASVLKWVRERSEGELRIDDVPGVTESQVGQLTRLSALIIAAVGDLATPKGLLDALRPAAQIGVPTHVLTAFMRLIDADPTTGLAALYAETVAAENRRTLGTFFTPRTEAISMVNEYARRFPAPEFIVDVGAGVGVFSEAARTQWPDAHINAIDVNPVTLGLQAVALSKLGDQSISLHLDDYSRWIDSFAPTGSTLYLGNPPYTRWQLIPMNDRQHLLGEARGLLDARANLSTLFLAITLKKLRPQDALCLIVPASWMSAQYARALRKHVRELRSRKITLRFADSWRFDSAIVDAVVVEIGPETLDEQALVTTDWPGTTLFQHPRKDDESPFSRLPRSPLTSPSEQGDATVELGQLAKVRRGVATGANDFFVVTKEQASLRGIESRWLHPLARRVRLGADPSHPLVEQGYLLKLDKHEAVRDVDMRALIAQAEDANVHKGYLCSQRSTWFDLSQEIRIPDVIMTSLGRDVFHVRGNIEGLAITNNLFGITWFDGVSDERRKETLSWLQSDEGQRALLESATTEANGLHRLSPRALSGLRLPVTHPRLARRDQAIQETETHAILE